MNGDIPSNPSVAVVICTYRRPGPLQKCLESLSTQQYPNFRTLVVDNTPGDDGTRRVAGRFYADYVTEPMRGLGRARNTGIRAVTEDIVVYIDDDAVASPGWLSALSREFSDPKVAAVTGRIVPSDNATADESELYWARIGGSPGGGDSRETYDHGTPSWFHLIHFVGIGNGGNMAIRRDACRSWRGFDERLGRGAPIETGEETLAFFELIRDGWRIVYTPDAVVHHPYPSTVEQARALQLRALPGTGAYLAMLLAEAPQYRRETLNYLQSKLQPGSWISKQSTSEPRLVSRWRVGIGWLAGALHYAKMCSRVTGGLPASYPRDKSHGTKGMQGQ